MTAFGASNRAAREHVYELAQELERELQRLQSELYSVAYHKVTTNIFIANDVGRVTNGTVALASDLVKDLDFSNAIGCDNTLGGDAALARRLADMLDAVKEAMFALSRDLEANRDLIKPGKDREIYSAGVASVLRLGKNFAGARNHALTIARAILQIRGRNSDLVLLRELNGLFAAFAARDVDAPSDPDANPESVTGKIARSAERLTCAASKVLPPRERSRYIEEWRSELLMVSQKDRDTRCEQIRYGLRVLARSASLRLALLWEPAAKKERV